MQQKYYNQRHHFREFYKEDLVLLNAKNLWTTRLSKKLSHKYIKPFCIKEPVEIQTYYLSLLTLYQIHSVFHVFLLKPYKSRGGEREAHIPESITIDEHDKYEIKEILDRKNIKNELWYKVKWLKWSQKYNQWIIYEDLEDTSELQNVYNKQYKCFKEARGKKRWRHSFFKFFPKGFLRFLSRLHKEDETR